MSVREFIADRQGKLLLHLIAALALSAFLLLTGTSGGVMIIVLIVWGAGLFMLMTTKYIRMNAYLKELHSIMDGLDQKHLFAECIPKPKHYYERELFKMMRCAGKSMIETVSDANARQQDYREYIENWVHEVKVPITAVRLICRNNKSDATNKIMLETGQIEEHVERALYYARAGGVERDFIIKETGLTQIVGEAIAKHQTLLMGNDVRIETEGLDKKVYTDSKWVSFMLGQLLSNAVRYKTQKPVIRIRAKQIGTQVSLCFEDNGIGISPHELARIFEKGFTGSNGRNRGGSTGMGLYICKKLAEFLQIEMSAQSLEHEYTKIFLVFAAKQSLT